MHYIIYKITNNLNNKCYVGKHQTTNLNDGYMGSGKLIRRAIKKYGIENFTKEIMFIFDSEAEMNAKEAEIVTEEFCKSNYNLCNGGHGGFSYINRTINHAIRNRKILARRDLKDPKAIAKRHATNKQRYGNDAYKIIALKAVETKKQKYGRAGGFASKPLPEDFGRRVSAGKKNKGLGSNNSNARCIMDENGIVFGSLTELAKAANIHVNSIKRRVKNGLYKYV